MKHFLEVTLAICQRTLLKTLRRPVALTFSLVQPLMWMGFFGFLFADYRLPAAGATERYIDFLAPGVCAMTVLFGASQAGVMWIRDLQTGFLARLLDTLANPAAILAGKLLADVLRLLVQAAAVLALALLLGARFTPSIPALALGGLCLALFAIAFASLSSLIALYAQTPETMGAYIHVVNMPLLFTSTALVPTRQMPEWLARLAQWNPLSLAVDAWRGALLLGEIPAWGQIWPLGLLAVGLYLVATQRLQAASSIDPG
jgi:ABC-2 type transport system permease protein